MADDPTQALRPDVAAIRARHEWAEAERAKRAELHGWVWGDEPHQDRGLLLALLDARPQSVTLAEIDAQRAKGWPDFGPEDYCHRCGGVNVPSWHVDSDRFNAALGGAATVYNGVVCPGCFVVLHEQATGLHATWTLTPITPFRPVDNG